MGKTNYIIICKISKNQIKIGDIIRVLELFKNNNFQIVTNKVHNSFFKKFNNKEVLDEKKFKNKDKKAKIINLVIGKIIDNSFFDINDFIDSTPDKIITYDLFKKLKKFKEKKKFKFQHRDTYKIGFNWMVPSNWKIKSYPQKNWQYLETNLITNNNIKISWQKKMGLKNYVSWINSCDIIISVVGLGVHISRYFNKPTIVLIGPTDFQESKNDNFFFNIYPKKRCSVHKKKLNINYKKCSCMKTIEVKQIIKKTLDLLNYE